MREAMAHCPICERPAKPRQENATFPFCSARCKTIDLGKWVNEEYRIPVTSAEQADPVNEDGGAPDGSKIVRH